MVIFSEDETELETKDWLTIYEGKGKIKKRVRAMKKDADILLEQKHDQPTKELK